MSVPLPVRVVPAVAQRVWFTPPRPSARALARDADRLKIAEPITVAVDGRGRPGFSVGEGPVVILAHGWGGRAAQMIDLAEAVAASGFKAVAIDAPGHGNDEQTSSDGFQMAAGLEAIELRLGPPAALITHSIGAMAAVLAFADRPPAAAVFLAPVLDLRDPLRVFSDRAKLAPWTARSLSRRIRSFAGDSWPEITAGAQADLPGAELLIVHDPRDRDAPFTTSARLATNRSRAQLVEVPGLGHNQLLRDPGVAEATSDFLADVRIDSSSR